MNRFLLTLALCAAPGLTVATDRAATATAGGSPNPPSAQAPGGSPTDPDESSLWRQVIEAQLDAFMADDGIAAFSFASPAIRRQFGTPERFLAMVRQAYPVVYRPVSVTFLAPRRLEGLLLQPVRLTDADQRAWIALYRMQRQADGTWRIDGCQLIEQAGTTT